MGSIWTGDRVSLRGIEPEDWRAFQHIDADTSDMRAVDVIHPPRSAEGYRRWAAEQAVKEPVGDEFQLAVHSRADDVLVGALSTTGTDQRAGRFGYGIGIGREHQRRGYATEAVVLLLRYMFGERRYHKCSVGVHAFNEASLALHRALGFEEEGRLREHEFFAGRHHDVVVLGMTTDEFADRHGFGAVAESGVD